MMFVFAVHEAVVDVRHWSKLIPVELSLLLPDSVQVDAVVELSLIHI